MGNPANEYQAPAGPPPGQQEAYPQSGGPPIHQSEPATFVPAQQPHESSLHDNQDGSMFVPPQQTQQQQDNTYYPPPPPLGEKPQQDQAGTYDPSHPNQNQPINPVAMHPPSYGAQPGQYPLSEQYVPSASQSNLDQPQHQQQQLRAGGKVSTWEKTKKGGKQGFDQLWKWGMKLGEPVNNLTNKIGSEAFWPSTLDKESDKAARILKSFCKDGFYTEPPTPKAPGNGPTMKQKVLVKIPQKVIQNAVGLAIFSTMRTGFWVSGAGGSGVLVARLPDGSWSPPSGILIHTLGVGFMIGIDIYDCVLVINSYDALKAFTTFRVTLGTEVSVVAGPVGAGGVIESDVRPNNSRSTSRTATKGERIPLDHVQTEIQQQAEREKRTRKPVFTYMKSRGLYAGLQVDGTFIVERNDENAAFYGKKIGVEQILKGNVGYVPQSTRMLTEVLKAAEGRHADEAMMNAAASVPPPSEINVEKSKEASYEQKAAFAPDADTKRQMEAMSPQTDGFAVNTHGGSGTINDDAAIAARLQQEEYTRASNIAGDIPPPQPPRPVVNEKNSAHTEAMPAISSSSTIPGPSVSSYPNEKSAAYIPPPPPPQQPKSTDAQMSGAVGGLSVADGEQPPSKPPRPTSEMLPPYQEAAGARANLPVGGDVKGPPAPSYK